MPLRPSGYDSGSFSLQRTTAKRTLFFAEFAWRSTKHDIYQQENEYATNNKQQPTFAPSGAIWRTRQNIMLSLILPHLPHQVKISSSTNLEVNNILHCHQRTEPRPQLTCVFYFTPSKKVKGSPYSLPSVGPGADPGVQAVSPQQ